jgi:aspartyl-tRNA synthetase
VLFVAAIAVRRFTALTQIVDVTSYLPQVVASTLRHSEQTVGCLLVRRSSDTAFYPIAHECPTEDGLVSTDPVPFLVYLCSHTWPRQDRIEITSENMTSWLADSPIVRGSRYDGGRVTSRLIQKLELQPGDIVWMGKQRDRPEVKAFVRSFLDCWSYDHILGRINSTWSAETSFG